MRNISFFIFFLVNVLWNTLYAQVTTPNGTSVDYQINSEGNVAQFEYDAAQWLSDRGWTSYVTRVSAATATYNCHSYAWYKSQGGTNNYWINAFLSTDLANFNMYSYYSTPPSPYNIQKYWTDDSYIEVPEGEATKVWYGSSWQWAGYVWINAYDHSAVRLESGLYESKWGAWPLYIHPSDKSPYANGNRRYFKKAPYIYGYPTVCPSSTEFTIEDLPSGATISWSTSSNITRVSNQGSNPCQFEANANGENGWIDATMTYSGNQYDLAQKNVWVGSDLPNPLTIDIRGEYDEFVEHTGNMWELCPNSNYYLRASPGDINVEWNWSLPESWELLSAEDSPEILIQTGDYITWEEEAYVDVYNYNCSTWIYSAACILTDESPSCGYLMQIILYPNPVKNSLTVQISENDFIKDKKTNFNVSIVDNSGRIRINKIMKENLFNIDISGLPIGEYTVVISKGNSICSKRFIKSN